jgi:hypothetical protein
MPMILAYGGGSRAVEKGDETIVELLLEYGAQPDLEDGELWSEEAISLAIVQLLLSHE